jgi:2-haloacid dehalogenase
MTAVPTAVASTALTAVVFDLGGVLIDWDPRHLYRRLMPEHEIDGFLAEIGFAEWNHAQDAGAPWAGAVESLCARHPHRRELIAAYPKRYNETLAGAIAGTVDILTALHDRGTRLLALTNWSAETFPSARAEFDFLEIFEGIVVSGEEGVAKPDPRLFQVLIDRFELTPEATVYIDDSAVNVDAAAGHGFVALRFRDPDYLGEDLRRLGLLPAHGAGSG